MPIGAIPVGARQCRNGKSGAQPTKESLMSTKLATIRKSAFEHQQGRCYYCRLPMWLRDSHKYAARYGLTRKQATLFQCTAEHLLPRKDGGGNATPNIVAACRFCNQRRHTRSKALSPERYKALVSRRLQKRRWQGPQVLSKLASRKTGPVRGPGLL